MTPNQAEAERVARELMANPFWEEDNDDLAKALEARIASAILAAEERRRQSLVDQNRKLVAGWSRIKDLLCAGHGPEECFRFKECAEKEKGKCVETVIRYLNAIIADRDSWRRKCQHPKPSPSKDRQRGEIGGRW